MQFHHKELAPVIYSSSGIKLRHTRCLGNDLCFPLHWHDRLELTLVHSGQLEVSLGDRVLTVLPGELVIVNCGQLHEGVAGPEGVEYDTLMFDIANFCNGTAASHALLETITNRTVSFLCHCTNPRITEFVRQLISDCQADTQENALQVEGGVYTLLGLLLQFQKDPQLKAGNADFRFRAVLMYIDEHFTENLSCRDLSSQFGYDEAYFCRRFKAITGLTPTRYIRILRLEYAQHLLRKKTYSTQALAAMCGFTDVGYFCRCFKAHYRVSPSDFLSDN